MERDKEENDGRYRHQRIKFQSEVRIMSHPEDIIAEMARALIVAAGLDPDDASPDNGGKQWSINYARACWAVVSKHQGWRPIETAPKNGRSDKVDLWMVVGETQMRMPGCWYDNDLGGWANYAIGHERLLNQPAITHWQPLPPPPSSAEEEG